MAKEFRPLLLENLEIHLPGMRLHQLALHQHRPGVEMVSPHRHPFHQCLLYLRGRGVQHLPALDVPLHRGSLLFVPAGTRHSFTKEREARPLCVVVDFDSADTRTWPTHLVLREPEISRVERDLFELNRLHEAGPPPSDLAVGALLLDIMALFEARLAHAGRHGVPPGPVARRIQRHFSLHDLADLSPGQIAHELGVGLDHLNRQLKLETGSTVGQFLAQVRLARACHLLAHSTTRIGEIGAKVGFLDQNYFARWFRRHTGQSPSQWRAGTATSSSVSEAPPNL